MLLIPRTALEEARRFFESAGSLGHEGTALLAGCVEGAEQRVTRLVIPDQLAGDGAGCWVEVTEAGKLQIAAALHIGERWLARIHSHPGRAFHSSTDDSNPVITADGSWSIVVPFFGLGLRHGLDACAVYKLERGTWRRVDQEELAREVVVAS